MHPPAPGPPSSSSAGHLQAISALEVQLRAHPKDWERWLVYADYLTDQGDARGRLITLAHRLAVAPLSEEECCALQGEIDALKSTHGRRWFEGLAPGRTKASYHHGFFCALEFYWRAGTLQHLEALAAHPSGRLLVELRLRWISEADVVALVRSPCLVGLPHLALLTDRAGPAVATAFAESRSLDALQVLRLERTQLGPEGAAALARSTGLYRLSALTLEGSGLGNAGVAALIPWLARLPLAHLSLAYNRLDAQVVSLLAALPLDGLVELNLHANSLGDEGARLLARSRPFPSLTSLNLRHNEIGDEGAKALASSAAFPSLRVLEIGGNRHGDEGKAALAELAAIQRCKVM